MNYDNPYDEGNLPATKPGTVAVEETRAMAEVKAQVFLAKQFPRDPVKATDRILLECDRLKLAEKAIYTFPRRTSQITGPSIRLAEAIQRSWGNIMSGIVEVERNDSESSMLAYAWDLETNAMSRQEFKVPHTRDTRSGKKTLTDDRDIYEMTANQGARRKRACILSLIPGDVVEAAVSRCEKTLVSKVGDLGKVIPAMVEKFGKIGITKDMIEKRLRHRIDSTQPAEVVQLGNIYNSIQDGMAVVSDFFETESTARPAEEVVKPAAPKPGEEPKDLFGETPRADKPKLAEIKTALFDYLEADIPDVIKGEIDLILKNHPTDAGKLSAVLEKAKTAYSKK